MDASKIKLIIWDLDETFWHGTISEQKVAPVKQACDLVLLSSKKGIVNSICSKNDEKPCIDKLKEWDLDNYFVFNSINWEPKGQRIKDTVESMNLRPCNVLFIDDNKLNLEEAKFFCPDIMTMLPDKIGELYAAVSMLDKNDEKLSRLESYKVLEKKNKITGLIGTAVLHILLLILLLVIAIRRPQAQEEGGVPVMLGNTELSQGNADPYTLTDVDIMNEPEVPAPDVSESEMVSPVETKEEIITQTEEETVTVPKKEPKREIPKKEKPKKETPKKDVPKKETVKPKEKTEAEKRAEAEKAEAEKKAAAERAAAEAAAKKIAGAFGKGTQMGNKGTGTTGFGLEGSPTGNSSEGKSSGVGGYGTFDLNGRSLGSGGLPMPVYNVQDEGRVVVTITVNPAGQVISTSINKRTNTVNASLRKAAEEAARKARFNQVDGVNNQTGTITYYFKLK